MSRSFDKKHRPANRLSYHNFSEAYYASALIGAGLPDGMAHAIAGWDIAAHRAQYCMTTAPSAWLLALAEVNSAGHECPSPDGHAVIVAVIIRLRSAAVAPA